MVDWMEKLVDLAIIIAITRYIRGSGKCTCGYESIISITPSNSFFNIYDLGKEYASINIKDSTKVVSTSIIIGEK